MRKMTLFLSRRGRVLPLLSIVIGSALVHLYLWSVRLNTPYNIGVLFGGVFAQSIGVLLLVFPLLFSPKKAVNREFFLICVLVMSFSVTYLRVSRFPIPFQADQVWEFQTASVSQDLWNPDLAVAPSPPGDPGHMGTGLIPLYNYIDCLSVTVFPTMASHVLEIDLFNLFRFFMPVIVGLMPLLFFVSVRRFLGEGPVTYLSVALTPLILFFPFSVSTSFTFRSATAIFMFYTLVYFLIRRDRVALLLAVLLGFGIVPAHYTVGYFTAFLLASSLLVSIVPRRLFPLEKQLSLVFFKIFFKIDVRWRAHPLARTPFLVAFLTLMFGWQAYLGWFVYAKHVDAVLYYFTHVWQISLATEASYAISSPRGPIVSAWFDLQLLLITAGALMGFYNHLKGKLQEDESAWILAGCVLGVYIVASTLLQNVQHLNIFLEGWRAISYSLPFVMSFLALSLVKLGRGKRIILVALFILLMLPMNMMLPSHEHDIMFHHSSTLPVKTTIQPYNVWARGEADMVAADWIGRQIGTREFVQVDSVSYFQMCLGPIPAGRFIRDWPPKLYPVTQSRVRYLVVHDIFMKYGVWYITYTNRTSIFTIYDPSLTFNSTIGELVYHNGAQALFVRTGDEI